MTDSDLQAVIAPDEGLSNDARQRLMGRVMAGIENEAQLREEQTKNTRWWQGSPTPVFASALVLIALATAVGAFMGVLPWQTQSALTEMGCRGASSTEHLVASARTEDGRTSQLFITRINADSPPNGYAVIDYDQSGRVRESLIACSEPDKADEVGLESVWAAAVSMSSDGTLITVVGHVPATAAVAELTMSDETVVDLEVQADGYFIGFIERPGVEIPDGPGGPVPELGAIHITAFDTNGSAIADQDLVP